MDEINLSYATMGLWMYFWDTADWGAAPVGQVPRATRYVWRHRVNYVTRLLLLWGVWELTHRWL